MNNLDWIVSCGKILVLCRFDLWNLLNRSSVTKFDFDTILYWIPGCKGIIGYKRKTWQLVLMTHRTYSIFSNIYEKARKNPRRLTPRECARLMGFPDNFKLPIFDTWAYKHSGIQLLFLLSSILQNPWLSVWIMVQEVLL